MDKVKFKKMVKDYDAEQLAWWNEEQLAEFKIQYRTLEAALNEGWLVYDGGDDVYVGAETYTALWYTAVSNKELNEKLDNMLKQYGIEFHDYGFTAGMTSTELMAVINEREQDMIDCLNDYADTADEVTLYTSESALITDSSTSYKTLTCVNKHGRTYTHEAATWARMYKIVTDFYKDLHALKIYQGWATDADKQVAFNDLFAAAATGY